MRLDTLFFAFIVIWSIFLLAWGIAFAVICSLNVLACAFELVVALGPILLDWGVYFLQYFLLYLYLRGVFD